MEENHEIISFEEEVQKDSNFTKSPSIIEMYGEDLTFKRYITNPAIAREDEIKKMMLVLLTPEKSAILVGHAGIGKTAIVEGLAYKIQNNEVPEALKGYKIYKISSKSMEPNLKYNDFILIKEKADFKENDIITFKVENKYITHRVVEIKDERIITKGDAVDFNNDPISKDMVAGKMIYKFKVLTYINYFLFKPIFWIIFISLYGIIFFIKTRRKK